MRKAALLSLVSLVLGVSPAALAQPTAPAPAPASPNAAAAEAKIASAKDHYAKGELGASLADLAEAYHLDARPDLLYAMAQIEVELDDCGGALAHYKQYLDTNPPQKARDATVKAMVSCQQKLGVPAEPAKPEPTPAPPPDHTNEATALPPPPPPASRPFYKDVVGDSLMGGGVVAGAVAGVFYYRARKDITDSATAATLADHDSLVTKADNLRDWSVGLAGVGGALAIAAVVRWAVHGGGNETPERVGVMLAPSPDGTGWGLAAVGRF